MTQPLTDAERRERADFRLTDAIPHDDHGPGNPYTAAVRASRVPMILTDPRQPDNPIIFANAAFQRFSGYAREEIEGRNCRFLQGPDTDRSAVARIRYAIERGLDFDETLLNYKKDGTPFYNALFVSPVATARGEVQFFFASQVDMTAEVERTRIIQEEVRARTAEADLARRELHHRVKNNLATIEAILRAELAAAAGDTRLEAIVRTISTRVGALVNVQRMLDQAQIAGKLDLSAFAVWLAAELVKINGREDVRIRSEIVPVTVPASDAEPLALILNELITNALKHAFGGRTGLLTLDIARRANRIDIAIGDDGPGFDPAAPTTSRGLGLATRMARSIGATIIWEPREGGTTVRVSVPERDW